MGAALPCVALHWRRPHRRPALGCSSAPRSSTTSLFRRSPYDVVASMARRSAGPASLSSRLLNDAGGAPVLIRWHHARGGEERSGRTYRSVWEERSFCRRICTGRGGILDELFGNVVRPGKEVRMDLGLQGKVALVIQRDVPSKGVLGTSPVRATRGVTHKKRAAA